jgi:hypothetical protein
MDLVLPILKTVYPGSARRKIDRTNLRGVPGTPPTMSPQERLLISDGQPGKAARSSRCQFPSIALAIVAPAADLIIDSNQCLSTRISGRQMLNSEGRAVLGDEEGRMVCLTAESREGGEGSF